MSFFVPPPVPHHRHHAFNVVTPVPVVPITHHRHHVPMLVPQPVVPLHVHHAPVVLFWADPGQLGNLAAADPLTVDHAVIVFASLASAGVSVIPHAAAARVCDTLVNEGMVLWLMRRKLKAGVERGDAKLLLQELSTSWSFARKSLKHAKLVTEIAKASGHPLGIGADAAVTATMTFATGLSVLHALELGTPTARALRGGMAEDFATSRQWLRLQGYDPRDAARTQPETTAITIGGRRFAVPAGVDSATLLDRFGLPREGTQADACRALSTALVRSGAPAAGQVFAEAAGLPNPPPAPTGLTDPNPRPTPTTTPTTTKPTDRAVERYAGLIARELITQVRQLDRDELLALLRHEVRHANRKTVIAAIEKALR
jgi:hypothetical protein